MTRTLTDVGETDEEKLKKKAEKGELSLQEQVTMSMIASGRTFRDLGNLERLAQMRAIVQEQYGEVTPETVRMAGITEMRERTALATLFTPQNMQGLVRVLGEAPEYADSWDIGQRLESIQMDPMIRQKYLQDRSAATAEAFALMGPESEAARERAARVRALGAEAGYGMGVDLETGEARFWRRAAMAGDERSALRGGGGYGGYYDMTPRVERSAEDRLAEALDRNQKALEEIAENTRTDKKPERVAQPGAEDRVKW